MSANNLVLADIFLCLRIGVIDNFYHVLTKANFDFIFKTLFSIISYEIVAIKIVPNIDNG